MYLNTCTVNGYRSNWKKVLILALRIHYDEVGPKTMNRSFSSSNFSRVYSQPVNITVIADKTLKVKMKKKNTSFVSVFEISPRCDK